VGTQPWLGKIEPIEIRSVEPIPLRPREVNGVVAQDCFVLDREMQALA